MGQGSLKAIGFWDGTGRAPLFTDMSEGDYMAMRAAARGKEFRRGEILYREGESVNRAILLTSGFAKITQLGPSGTEVILRFGTPGDILDGVSLLSTGKHGTTAQAFRSCRTLVWDASVFKTNGERYPILYQSMGRALGEHLLDLEVRFREVATEKVGPRVARQLARLLKKMGRQVNGEIEIALSREDLAQMTGTTLFTVSRLLSAWEARGIVTARREVVAICDVRSLLTISD